MVRSVPPLGWGRDGQFLFDWNPLIGGTMPAAAANPRDVVDIIGLDVYDDAINGADPGAALEQHAHDAKTG
jgi:hypothetical protein